MSWLIRMAMGLALALGASAALAGCPDRCGGGGGFNLPTYGDVAQHYGYRACGGCGARQDARGYGYEDRGYDRDDRYDDRGPPPCREQRCGGCRQCGELTLGNFYYDGGVGPYPEGGYGGGGYVMSGGGGFAGAGAGAGAGASASARASAFASSSSHVSINIGRGGGRKGGCNTCGGYGHK